MSRVKELFDLLNKRTSRVREAPMAMQTGLILAAFAFFLGLFLGAISIQIFVARPRRIRAEAAERRLEEIEDSSAYAGGRMPRHMLWRIEGVDPWTR